MPVRIFLSYARSDDEAFVRRLYDGLIAAGFKIWFDRVSMPSRQLSFSKEIEAAIASCDRLVLVVGPGAVFSDYVTHEWRFAFHKAVKCVNAILRRGDYDLLPEDLRGPHVEDFRDDEAFDFRLANLVRQLSDPLPPLGKLVAVPALPAHYLEQGDRIRSLRDMLLADLRKPVVVSGAAGRVGLHGMGGIGKSLLANAVARRPEIRREFPDGVFWVTLGQQPLLVELQRNVAKALDDEAAFTTAEQGRERLRELLKDRAALLILDDVWQREHAEAFNVIGPRCRLLLTTRDAGLVTALAAKENHYQVQLPTVAEARAILAKAAGVTELADEARAIIEECDRLPLALALCGGMVYVGTSWADLLEALRGHDLRFLSDAHPGEEQHANVWKAIDVSVRVLPEAERRRFAELAVFALDTGAPEAAVETLWEHTASLEPRHARKLVRELAARSLVELDSGRVTLHDVVHGFATGMTADPRAVHRVLLDAYWKKCPDGWASGPNDSYFLENLCGHLVASGRGVEAGALLSSAPWGMTKCAAGLVFNLEQDFDEVTEGEALSLIHGALMLSMHVLAMDSRQYASQMVGRLLAWRDQQEVARFVEEITVAAPRPWLRPIHPCLDAPGGPLFRTLKGHADRVLAVAVTGDGKRVVSASADDTLKVWDLEKGLVLQTLKRHSSSVCGVVVTADGKRAVSASWDDTLKVWDLEKGCALHTLRGHSEAVVGLAATSDGKLAVSASYDNTLKVWDLETRRALHTLEGHSAYVSGVAITADGKRAVSASWDKTLKVWDLEIGHLLQTLEGHSGAVEGVAVTADGRRAVSASDDATLKVWDIESGVALHTMEGHTSSVLGVAVTTDGKRAVSASADDTLKVWNLETGRLLRTLEGHSDIVRGVAITADGRRAVSASDDHTLKLWDLVETPLLEGGNLARAIPEGHSTAVLGVLMSADGKTAISASHPNTVKMWSVDTGRVSETVEERNEWINGNAVMIDRKRAISAHWDHSLKLWDGDGGGVLFTLTGHSGLISCVVVTADGQRAVSASYDKTLRVWDLENGRAVLTLKGHSGPVTRVAVTADGKRAVSSSADKTLKVWDLSNGHVVHTLKGHADTVWGVAVTVDGMRAVSAASDKAVKVWDIGTGAALTTFACEGVAYCCATGPPNVIVFGDIVGRVHFLALED